MKFSAHQHFKHINTPVGALLHTVVAEAENPLNYLPCKNGILFTLLRLIC